jgi:AcrR family transcriptional regulator
MPTERPLRADAERNRGRILDAAAELFAAKGLSVGLDEIAHHAGVGVATAYRRFPDKRKLIEALFEERLGRLVKLAERGLAADDAWEGLTGFIEQATELQIANRGLKEIVFGSDYGAALSARIRDRLAPLTEQLVRRAQASGALRADVVATDLAILQFMLSSAAELTAPHAPQLWRRYLALAIDGLRTPDPRPLPQPGLSDEEFPAAVHTARGRVTTADGDERQARLTESSRDDRPGAKLKRQRASPRRGATR